jgi:hypothetical protein
MGVHKGMLFDGTEQIQVAFMDKAPRLVDAGGRSRAQPASSRIHRSSVG